MSTIYTLTYSGAAIVDKASPAWHGGFSEAGVGIFQPSAPKKYLLIRFPAPPSAILYKKLLNIKVKLWIYNPGSATDMSVTLWSYGMDANFDPDTVTWNTTPAIDSDKWGSILVSPDTSYVYKEITFPSLYYENGAAYAEADKIAQISKRALASMSLAFQPPSGKYTYYKNAPQLIVEVDESVTISSQVAPDNSPTSGWINPTLAHTFAWKYVQSESYPCIGNFEQVSAAFHWRAGTSGSWTDIAVSGTTQSVTIPADTFPGGTIQWYVSGTDSSGTSSQTDVYTLTTTDSESVATPAEPIGTVEDGSAPIILEWIVANDTGSLPTGADLQKSSDGSTWTTFAQISGAATEYSAPANTFAAGRNYWRVRSYNRDGVAGSWSAAVQFVSVAAPAAPSVSCDAKPFAAVSWQSSGQQVYEVTVDGKVYGPFFGTAKNFTLPDYLPDGNHSASVRIQGTYGLWSEPGSVDFTVTNVPGDDVTLTGVFKRDAALTWTTDSATADFLIYRDDVQIGRSTASAFTDRFVLGEHNYCVVNRLAGGYYTRSNYVAGTLRSCVTALAPLSGGDWIELAMTEDSETVQEFTWTRTTVLRHVAGAMFPVIEMSPYEDLSGSYSVGFADLDAARAFEALRGQVVIVKSRAGNVVIGCLNVLDKSVRDFFIAFKFTVQRVHVEDYVDDAND